MAKGLRCLPVEAYIYKEVDGLLLVLSIHLVLWQVFGVFAVLHQPEYNAQVIF